MTSTELALREATQSAIAQLDDPEFVAQIELALPEGVSVRHWIRVLKTAILVNPELSDTGIRRSFLEAGLRLAQLGLRPDDEEAHLEIYSGKGGAKVQVMPMIRGLKKIAAEHGWMLLAEVVYENDEFEPDPENHRVNWRRPKLGADRGLPIGAFALAEHRDGRKYGPLVMDKAEIEKVRATSRAKNGPAWTNWWDRMWQKTVARRLFKDLPLDPADKRIAGIRTVLDSEQPADLLYGEEGQDRRAAGLPLARPRAETAGETPIVASESAADSPAAISEDTDPDEPSDEELDAMVAAAREEEAEVIEAEAVEDEEPTEQPRFITSYGKSKYEGMTIQEVFEKDDHGKAYIKWALTGWKTEPMRAALIEWANDHPEVL